MTDNERLQVNTLCKWITVKLAPSAIDGVGIHAIKDMPVGTKLYGDIMPEIFKLPYKVLKNNTPEYVKETVFAQYPMVINDSAFIYPTARFVAYCNHSDDPNYDAKEDILLRSVEEGEEITEDYRLIEGWQELYPFLV